MLSRNDILETIRMIDQQHLDIRTITMGISLLSCADSSAERACEKIYDKISRYAERLVATGEEIEREFGIPIVNKRVSVTPIALVAAALLICGGLVCSSRNGLNRMEFCGEFLHSTCRMNFSLFVHRRGGENLWKVKKRAKPP